MKYCIFGGSFDPPHEGHRYLARSAVDSFKLDRLIWVPAQDPPLKAQPGTPFEHRVAMVRLLTQNQAEFEVSDIEATLPTPSYSLTTIQALKAAYAAKGFADLAKWFFLIGADNWAVFPKWHRWQDVLKEVTLVVFPRHGFPIGPLPAGVLRLDLAELNAESRSIRKTLSTTHDFDAAHVPMEIRSYISAHGLYGMDAAPKSRRGSAGTDAH